VLGRTLLGVAHQDGAFFFVLDGEPSRAGLHCQREVQPVKVERPQHAPTLPRLSTPT
jgi:hypothetical protein